MAVTRGKSGASGSGAVKPAAIKSVAIKSVPAPKAKSAAPVKPLAEVIPPPAAKPKLDAIAPGLVATAPAAPVKAAPVKTSVAVHSKPQPPIPGVNTIMQSTKKMSENLMKSYGDLAGFGKGNVEAVVKSSTIVARGFEELSRQFMALAQSNMEHSVAAAKAALNCTTLKQIVDLQSDFAKTTFDTMVAEGNKLSEMSYKMTNEAIEPLQARMTLAVQTFGKPLAA